MARQTLPTLVTISVLLFVCHFRPISCVDFIYNTFNSSSLLLYGEAVIESSVLTLTGREYSTSRALYPQPIPTRTPNTSELLPFSTSFIFSISPSTNPIQVNGFAFLFAPFPGIDGTSSVENFGLLNSNNGNLTTPFFAIKFLLSYYFRSHVGIIMNSLTSITEHEAGYWIDGDDDDDDTEFRGLQLNNGENYQVWIDYANSHINVTMAKAGMKKPKRPLITDIINLSGALSEQMYVGFSASNYRIIKSQRILCWSFSNSNFSIGDSLITENLPSFVIAGEDLVIHSKGFIIGISLGGMLVILRGGYVTYFLLIKRRRKLEEPEDWESEYWPHRIDYQDINKATEGFAEQNVIGDKTKTNNIENIFKVESSPTMTPEKRKTIRGLLQGGIAVAVKRISLESAHGMKEFLAEISSLGRLKHRNLVGLRGWSKTQKRGLMLVYDYMDCGSLDKWLFGSEENQYLDWQQRIKILTDVASGILYLHEGWEARVVHGDIKASNVLLDKDTNARLGDFGLARVYYNEQSGDRTRVIGTVGYMAPELLHNGRASTRTDVYSFGIVILEVVCGQRPIEEGKQGLADWVNELMQKGKPIDALDKSLKQNGKYSEDEVEKLLSLGLLCANREPNARPSMRQVLKALEGTSETLTLEDIQIDMNSTNNIVSTEIAFLSSCTSLSDAILEGR